jgi:hypothetical protein
MAGFRPFHSSGKLEIMALTNSVHGRDPPYGPLP